MIEKKKLTTQERGTILSILNPFAAIQLTLNASTCTDEQIEEFLDLCGMPTTSNEPWYLLIQGGDELSKKINKAIRKTIKKHYKLL